MATVIGPTPPGTGVIYPATCFAASKSTSPHNFCDVTFVAGSVTRREIKSEICLTHFGSFNLNSPANELIPQSTTTAPGLIQSAFTNFALPIATTKISASRTFNFISRSAIITNLIGKTNEIDNFQLRVGDSTYN